MYNITLKDIKKEPIRNTPLLGKSKQKNCVKANDRLIHQSTSIKETKLSPKFFSFPIDKCQYNATIRD